MSTWGYTGMVAWLLVLTALLAWAIYSVERSHHRIDTLGDRQDRVDDLARQVQDWWDDGEEMGTEPAESPVETPKGPHGSTDTPPHGSTALSEALRGSEPIDRVRVPLPPPAATVAIPAVSGGQEPEPFEPEAHPETQPAIERRGIGQWVTGPGGSLVYRPTSPEKPK